MMKNENSAGRRTRAPERSAALRRADGSTGRSAPAPRGEPAGRTEAEDLQMAERRKRRAMLREQRERSVRRQKILFAAAAVVFILLFIGGTSLFHKAWAKSSLSEEVLSYKKTIEKYAKREKIQKYTDTLLAIMMVESEGKGEDVMQSSESKGLERNSLGPEESIEQACIYFAALIEIADDLEIKDDKALIQSYNFGPGYLVYISKNGKKHSEKLAEEYAKEHSGGEKVRFLHVYAIKKNGGWIYKFGNMFYEAIVEQYL